MDSLMTEFGNENGSEGVPEKIVVRSERLPLISIPDPFQYLGESELSRNVGFSRSAQSTPVKFRSGNFSKTARTRLDFRSAEIRHFDLDADPLFWNDHNVQVLIRIRPVNFMEKSMQGEERCLIQESSKTLTWTGHPETRFTFDHVACETISQETLFHVAGLPMVENCMRGYNSCIFAYGQTSSGKTYTMMGELREISDSKCEDCGMTPRIFESLFEKIKKEEEERKNENLKYTCKCSYLEIFNEQITDLLDPSSTNLHIREDLKKGIYVENLKEHDVSSVNDVIELLVQGTANRKTAGTSMNSESSRSHSVFTCRIESQWERDSMVHIRFGRLNLVDLAGSERQRSSGAEGERLKEAASINKSLSTLGLVIMTLVDIANGKHRHVPYRDSRLTFLLQDSLGGNSKTAIIANVSPSICSANETLSTLKFAQRAKLIQNNAKVNENASGDVMAFQREIQRLRDQLNIVIKHRNIPATDDFGVENPEQSVDHIMEFLKEALASSLKREVTAEDRRKSLETECDHLKLEVHKMKNQLLDGTIQRSRMLTYDSDEKNNALDEGLALSKERIGDQFCKQLTMVVMKPNIQIQPLSSTQHSTNQHVVHYFCPESQETPEIGLLTDDLKSGNIKKETIMDHKEVDPSVETTVTLLERENQELRERLNQVTYSNSELLGVINEKEVQIKVMAEEWEKAVLDLTSFLLEGCQSLEDATVQINTILESFPNCKTWINDHVERVMKVFIEKEMSIVNLKKNLDDAQKIGSEMKYKLNTLRGAMLALTETHEFERHEVAQECMDCFGFSDGQVDDSIVGYRSLNQGNESEMGKICGSKLLPVKEHNDDVAEEKKLVHLGTEGDLLSSFCEALSYAASLMVDISELIDSRLLRQLNINNPEDKVTSQSDACLTIPRSFCSESLNEKGSIICFSSKDSLIDGAIERQYLGVKLEVQSQISKLLDAFENFQRKLSGELIHIESNDLPANLSDQINADNCYQRLQILEQRVEKVDIIYSKTREILEEEIKESRSFGVDQSEETTNLFLKFEEAHETMKEADLMVQQLLLANENSLLEVDKWKQISREVEIERDSLAKELDRTREFLEDGMAKDQLLLDQIVLFVAELATVMGEFQEMINTHASAELNEIRSCVMSSLQEIHEGIVASKLLVKSSSERKQRVLHASSLNENHNGSLDGNSSFQVSNSLESVKKDAETVEFFKRANLGKKREIINDLGFSKGMASENNINNNSNCFSSNSGGRDHKGDDLTMKIAKVDAMLSIKRGTESPWSGNSADTIIIPSRDSLVKPCKEKNRREVGCLNGSAGERKLSAVGEILKELIRVKGERDKLQDDVLHLNGKLDMARAIADENEAVAVEACNEAKASIIYAQEKEEEVRVLESTVSELESTVDVLENKVSEMAEEVKRYQQTREELELGLQILQKPALIRPSDTKGRNLTRDFDTILLELYDSKKKIEELEKETTRQAKEIKRYEEHISEIMLHSEAQSSLYHQKFQNLESLVSDAKKIPSSVKKIEMVPVRSRGSVSPLKCMSSLIQQMNSQKDEELSLSRIRVEQLEELAANRQKQVCMLSARLAAVDNMTHDVIRDLLEVKLDITNYADTMEMENQKIVSDHKGEDKEDEIIRLKGMLSGLLGEKDRWIEAMKLDFLAMQEKLEKLQQKHQHLTAQNDMLKMDKRNLTRKIAEQDEVMKLLIGPKSFQELIQSPLIDEKQEIGPSRSRPTKPGKLLLQGSRTSRYGEAHEHRPNINDRCTR